MADYERVGLRGLSSEAYRLGELRPRQLAAPRVRNDSMAVQDGKVVHCGDSERSSTWWRLGPPDDPFWTQSLQVHFAGLPPDTSIHGHGSQNEATFYILEGRGYAIHDDQRQDWSQGDLVFVQTDSVRRHDNPYQEPATYLVMKSR